MNTPDDSAAIRFATFLSPNIYRTYEHIARYVGERVKYPTTLRVGQCFEEIAAGQIEVAFICGLPYVQLASRSSCSVKLLAAPVLRGERYRHKPLYFSDVIVANDSPCTSFDDLRGCRWGYNQKTSHSGYNLVCYSLLERGLAEALPAGKGSRSAATTIHDQALSYFGTTIETGSHLRSIQMVLEKEVDATAVDSHVLDVFLSKDRDLAAKLRMIDMFGPSSIPPVVVSRKMDRGLQRAIQDALLTMHDDPLAARQLHQGSIEQFVQVADEDYDDIRRMLVSANEVSRA